MGREPREFVTKEKVERNREGGCEVITDKHDLQQYRPTWRKQGKISAPSKVHRAAASDQDN